ncbi:hypothetical protein [Streptomyces marispadix]|uniref:Uncharacterized protein n=1 Tax=Streptomyces marispadix TaxID=2922868 RepID=A0ABS9STD7_9ACTN|nr:hypothetical protein [Streptomyces marispadix]MCH6159428.1 hypothetical protein [Streptomyces marispadix]
MVIPMVLKDLWRRLHEFHEEQIEIWERINLLNRPWEEEILHWARAEEGWVLHGRIPPPARGHRTSVTRRGWCPGLRPRGGAGQPPSASS